MRGSCHARLVFPPDEMQIAGVDEKARELTDDEDGVGAIDRVGEQGRASGEAEIPEGDGHDAAATSFAGEPLHEETHREKCLTEQADTEPNDVGVHFDSPFHEK